MRPADIDRDTFRARYGPWGVVAGAVEGLGAAWTAALAARGLDLLLVDRRGDLLATAAPQLARNHGVDTAALTIDLAAPDAIEAVLAAAAGREVGFYVHVAAASDIGPFVDIAPDAHRRALAVNCLAPALLAHHFGGLMRQRRRGGIVLMSSLSGFQGNAWVAHYAATKAYNLVLAEGLWDELRGDGVEVLAVSPGATLTPTYLSARPADLGRMAPPEMTAEAVVAEALAALGRQPSMIAGAANRRAAFVLHRLLPRRAVITMMGRYSRLLVRR
jgi:short-subunit dehydrogenase